MNPSVPNLLPFDSGGWRRWGRYAYPANASAVKTWFFRVLLAPGGGRERLARWAGANGASSLAELMKPGARRSRALSASEMDSEPMSNLESLLTGSDLAGWLGARARTWRALIELPQPGVTGTRLLAFFFPDGADEPTLILRVETLERPEARKAIWDQIDALRAQVPVNLAETLPRLVGWVETGGAVGELSEALPGRSGYSEMLSTLRPRRTFEALLRSSMDWLARFQRATLIESTDGAQRLARTASHGDFWVRNILFRGHAVSGVLDWKSGVMVASSDRDLSSLIISLADVYQRRRGVHDGEEAFRKSFVESGWVRTACERALKAFALRQGHTVPALDGLLRLEIERRLSEASPEERREGLRRRLCLLG